MNAIGGYLPAAGRGRAPWRRCDQAAARQAARRGLGRTFQAARLFGDLTVRETFQVALEGRHRTGFTSTALFLPRFRSIASDAPKPKRSSISSASAAMPTASSPSSPPAPAASSSSAVSSRSMLACSALMNPRPAAPNANRSLRAAPPPIRQELDASLLVIEHDMPLIMSISDRVYCLETGNVIAEGRHSSARKPRGRRVLSRNRPTSHPTQRHRRSHPPNRRAGPMTGAPHHLRVEHLDEALGIDTHQTSPLLEVARDRPPARVPGPDGDDGSRDESSRTRTSSSPYGGSGPERAARHVAGAGLDRARALRVVRRGRLGRWDSSHRRLERTVDRTRGARRFASARPRPAHLLRTAGFDAAVDDRAGLRDRARPLRAVPERRTRRRPGAHAGFTTYRKCRCRPTTSRSPAQVKTNCARCCPTAGSVGRSASRANTTSMAPARISCSSRSTETRSHHRTAGNPRPERSSPPTSSTASTSTTASPRRPLEWKPRRPSTATWRAVRVTCAAGAAGGALRPRSVTRLAAVTHRRPRPERQRMAAIDDLGPRDRRSPSPTARRSTSTATSPWITSRRSTCKPSVPLDPARSTWSSPTAPPRSNPVTRRTASSTRGSRVIPAAHGRRRPRGRRAHRSAPYRLVPLQRRPLNRLHDAADWSFRTNACDIPTDCPQRERAGWTGDWQLFSPTAAFLYDVAGFSTKWLRDLAADQRDDGAVRNFAPDPAPPGATTSDQDVPGGVVRVG